MEQKIKHPNNLYKELKNFALAIFVISIIILGLFIHAITKGIELRISNVNDLSINASTSSSSVLHEDVKWGIDIFFMIALELCILMIGAVGILRVRKIGHDNEHYSEWSLLWIITFVTSFFMLAWIPSFILFLWLNKEAKDYVQAPNNQVPATIG